MAEENKEIRPLSRKEQKAQEENQAQARIKKTLIGVGAVCAVLAVVMVVSDINTEKNRTVVDKNFDYITDGAEVPVPSSFGTVNKLEESAYKGVELDKSAGTEITDTVVDYYITAEREEDTVVTEITDRAAQLGDFANIDYTGMMDGEAFDGGSGTGYELELGSGTFIEGFEDGVVGMNVGETKTLDLKFPDDYSSTDLAGKDAQFIVTLNSLETKEVPELTDEWVSKHTDGEFTNVADYTADYKTRLQKQSDLSTQYSRAYAAIQTVAEDADVTASVDGIKYLYNSNYATYETMAASYSMTLDSYLTASGTDLATFKQNLADYSETVAEQVAVIEAIYEKEGMTLTDEDEENMELMTGMDKDELVETYSQEWFDLNEKMTKVMLYVYDTAVQKPVEETTAAESAAETTVVESAAETVAETVEETTAVETTAAETTAAK